MLFKSLKNAKKNITPKYVNGRLANPSEEIDRKGKLFVFETPIGDMTTHNLAPAVFTIKFDGEENAIYQMRHAEALVVNGFIVFTHTEEPDAVVYKLFPTNNVLTYYQYAAASAFGLDKATPIAHEHNGKFTIANEAKWEDFLKALIKAGYADEETVENIKLTEAPNI